MRRLILTNILVSMSACVSTGSNDLVRTSSSRPAHTPFSQMNYPVADPEVGEKLYPNEVEAARTIAALLEQNLRKSAKDNRALRESHPKTHGCAKASFSVAANLAPELRHGMFEAGRTYEAVVRFSNAGGGATTPDIEGGARGMAIKVLGVSGQKLLDGESAAQTQDFVLVNFPVFFLDDPAEYVELVQKTGSSDVQSNFKELRKMKFAGLPLVRRARKIKITSPLRTRYFSMTPYQLGIGPNRRPIKYSTRPCRKTPGKLPRNPHPDYLRHRLVDQLAENSACFEFMIQAKGDGMEVERPSKVWRESASPFIPIAKIILPKQQLPRRSGMEEAANRRCDSYSFNPWHSLSAHRPLGAVNRLRKVVYEHLSKVRHGLNEEVPQEP